jgi:photosystem II stability/assembly factor-like uncharacterized protein
MFFAYKRAPKGLKKPDHSPSGLSEGALGSIQKKTLAIFTLFAIMGIGGVVAASNIRINSASPVSIGAGYYGGFTACDENVTLNAQSVLNPTTGQFNVTTISLSNISQNATTGCGDKTMELALKVNGQVTFTSFDIPASSTDATFNFATATSSLGLYATSALTPFDIRNLTDVAIAKIGSFSYSYSETERRPAAAITKSWTSVAASADGTKIAAAASSANIYTSTDSGATWTARTTSRSWNKIVSSADGTALAATVNGTAAIYTSADSGANWTTRTASAITTSWPNVITSSSDGTKLAAAGYLCSGSCGGYVITSADSGATWTERSGSGYRVWKAIAGSADGTKLVAAVSTGYIYTSTDSGATWTERTSAGSRTWDEITMSSDGTKIFAIMGYGYGYVSTDSGVTWTVAQLPNSGAQSWNTIASSADGTMLLASVNGYIYASYNSGYSWASTSSAQRAYAIAFLADGLRFVSVDGAPGYVYTGSITKTRSSN